MLDKQLVTISTHSVQMDFTRKLLYLLVLLKIVVPLSISYIDFKFHQSY